MHRIYSLLAVLALSSSQGATPTPGAVPQPVPLSGEDPSSARQDWGSLESDISVGGKPITLGGRTFSSGLGMHANGEATYDLAEGTQAFEALVGVDDTRKGDKGATVVFQVFVDGEKKFDSGLMRAGDAPKPVSIDLRGARTLKLVALDGGDGKDSDWADWADAKVTKPALPPATADYTIEGGGLRVSFAKNGRILGLELHGSSFPATGRLTTLAGCNESGETKAQKTDQGVAFTRTLADTQGHRANVTDTFMSAADGVRWIVDINSDDAPWTTAITSGLRCMDPGHTKVWAGCISPDASKQPVSAWRDPLVPGPFVSRTFTYGAATPEPGHTIGTVTLPLVSFLSPASDTGLSLVFAPSDVVLDAGLELGASGQARWTRTRHRIGGGKTVSFHTTLVPHEADWRGGLRFMTKNYPEFFEPINPRANQIAGCGAYSTGEEKLDVDKLKKMAFGFNWKLSDDFPYMGMFIPPVKTMDETWERSCAEASAAYVGRTTSCRRMNDYAQYMKANRFSVLSYFNVTEFGKDMNRSGQRKEVRNADDPELWKDPAGFVKYKLPNAVVNPGIQTCYYAYIMDVGDPDYQAFMIEQAKRNCEFLPATDGICIDRTDWLRIYNGHADDGVSWVDGKPARSLHRSWAEFISKLDPLMHGRDKMVFVNILSARLDTLRGTDGVYTEYGLFNNGDEINIAALLCPKRPAVMWTMENAGSDAMMQRQMYLGVFPTATYPHNNHCINPSSSADALYLDYGPLLEAMRGRKWVLAPHCVETTTPGAKVNLFEVKDGYALPVTFGGEVKEAVVTLRNVAGLDRLKATALQPGAAQPVEVKTQVKGGALKLTVPLARGCAMVKLTK
jgi:hypothetical protein